jgi:hypothetical protein
MSFRNCGREEGRREGMDRRRGGKEKGEGRERRREGKKSTPKITTT